MNRIVVREWVLLAPIFISLLVTAFAVWMMGEAQRLATWQQHRVEHCAEMYEVTANDLGSCIEAFKINQTGWEENKKSLDLIRAKLEW
jgi:hypothetical protein